MAGLSNRIIQRPLPNAVTYDLSSPFQTTITLPPGSTWSSGYHWHETHTEYLLVLKGNIRVRLDNKISIVAAGREITIPKFARHEWQRAEEEGEDVVVRERTEPADVEKSIFFWVLNGIILGATGGGGGGEARGVLRERYDDWIITVRLFALFRALDNWPVLWEVGGLWNGMFRGVKYCATHCVLFIASLLVGILRYDVVEEKVVPSDVLEKWKMTDNRAKKKD